MTKYDPLRRRFLLTATLLPSGAPYLLRSTPPAAEPFPPPKWLGDVRSHGRHLQRTMTLLATSTPRRRHTVRILFYGQSITEQGWTKIVTEDLRRRFPFADLVVENRAIGGHSSQRLVRTAEADLYPFYPDLLIFHVYGSQTDYEEIIRRTRERTTAEILIQNDHLSANDALDEETDPARLGPRKEVWPQYMNYSFLPEVARKYGAELCDQRAVWKRYLQDYGLRPRGLLKDGVHLNAHGEYLMAECVKSYLRYDPSFSPAEESRGLVRTYRVGREVPRPRGRRLALDFAGNRVDLLLAARGRVAGRVMIDGQSPARHPELYGFTRTRAYPESNWPCLLRVAARAPLLVEEWKLTLRELSADYKLVSFSLAGSRTGPDGEGSSDRTFVSPSGRVVIEPADWNLAYALSVFKRPLPAGFEVTWKVVPHFVEEIVAPAESAPGIERSLTVAQGLSNTRHRIEIEGAEGIEALRIFQPPRGSAAPASGG